MKKIVEITHDILKNVFHRKLCMCRLTMGQGFDTLFFSKTKRNFSCICIRYSATGKEDYRNPAGTGNCLEKLIVFLMGMSIVIHMSHLIRQVFLILDIFHRETKTLQHY